MDRLAKAGCQAAGGAGSVVKLPRTLIGAALPSGAVVPAHADPADRGIFSASRGRREKESVKHCFARA